jgi:integrase
VLESLGGEGQGRIFKRWSHPDTISKVIKRALKDAGLEHLTLHSLRHTFASQAIMQGRTLRDVQDLLGHTESRTTEIYAHLADEHLAQAADIKLGPMDLVDNKRAKDEIAERIQKQKA